MTMRVGSDRVDDYDQLFLEEALIRGGMDPRQAEKEAALKVMREKQARARAGMPRDADGRPALSPREAEFDNDMALAMGQVAYGNGAEVDNLAAAATPIDMDREFGATTPRKPVSYRVPGPVDSNNYAAPGEAIYDEEEAVAYLDRQASAAVEDQVRVREMASPDSPYRGGAELPSQRDRDMYARGMVPTVNPETGEVGFSVAFPPGGADLGRPGLRGRRPELQKPVRDARTGAPIPDSMMYEPQTIDSPLGPTVAYLPSDAYRTELDRREQVARTHRLAERAGYSRQEAAELATSGGEVNLEQLRLLGNSRRAADKAARQQAVVRRAQAQYNPMEYMNRGDINDWQRMVTANRLLGPRGYRGATPLDVNQAAETALALREQRLATGEGFQPRSPQEQELLQQRIDEQKPVAVRAQEQASRGRVNHPDVLQYADDLVNQHYSSRPGVLGVSSYFTDNEVALAAARLSQDLDISEEQALQILRRIQQDRNRNSVASGIVAGFYDQ